MAPILVGTVLVILVLDAFIPLGVAVWIGYLVPILLSVHCSTRTILMITSACGLLLFVGLVISPPGVPASMAVINRTLGAGALALVASFVLHRKAAETALLQSERRARLALDGAMDGVVTINTAGQIVYWNPAAATIFGWAADEIRGQPLERLIPPQYRESHAAGFRRFQQTGTGPIFNWRLELAGLRKNGQELPIELTVLLSPLESGYECTAFVRDTTERKLAQTQLEEWAQTLERRVEERTSALRAAIEQLQEIDRTRSAFVNIVSHEMRTPLSASLGYVDNMLDEIVGPLTDGQVRYLSRVRDNIRRLARLINDLLDLALAEEGRLPLHLTEFAIDPVLDEVLDTLRPFADTKSVTIRSVSEGPLPSIHADRDKLLQAVINIVHNAIKFTPQGGTILITAWTTGSDCHIEVLDTGPGVAPDAIEKIFDKFYSAGPTVGSEKGIGLGLTITKRLIELHGGRVELESTDHGTMCRIVLPFRCEGAQRQAKGPA